MGTRKVRRSRAGQTKEMLLPFRLDVARGISLENHLSLVTMRAGHGTSDTMVALLRVLYMTFYVLGKDCTDADLRLFREVEDVLNEGIEAAAAGHGWRLPSEGLREIERLMLRSDDAVASLPKHRYIEAWQKLNAFVRSEQISPLPGSRLKGAWDGRKSIAAVS